jgi:hypothetical protein
MHKARPWGWFRVAIAAGLTAGLLTAAFNILVSEPVLDEAVRLEASAASSATAPEEGGFTREQQHAGMILGQLVLGAGVGLIFAGLGYLWETQRHGHGRRRFWLVSAGTFAWSFTILPAMKYPPLPPGVESTLNIGERQAAYLALAMCGVLGVLAAVWALRRTARRGFLAQTGIAALALLAPAVPAFLLLPDAGVVGTMPYGIELRLVSITSQSLFWLSFAFIGWLLNESVPEERVAEEVG